VLDGGSLEERIGENIIEDWSREVDSEGGGGRFI
jgi:hypothetical protein